MRVAATTGGDTAGAATEPGVRHDLRLVPAALAVWAVLLAGLLAGPVVAAGVTVTAAAGFVAALTPRCRTRTWAGGALATAGCAAAAGLVITLNMFEVNAHPLAGPAAHGASARLRVELTDDPRPLRGTGYGARPGGVSQVLVSADLLHVEVGGGSWAAGGRVLLLAPPEGWSVLLPGQAVTAEGLLAPAQRRDLTVAVLRVRGPPRAVGAPSWIQLAAGGLRDGLRDAAVAALPAASAGLLPGLAVGDTRGQSLEVEQDFRAAGLTHLTAVSGANLAIVGGVVLGLLRLFRADPRLAAALSGVAVAGFVVLARPSPSVLRAAVMAAVVLLALVLGRRRSAVPALAAAVLVLLLADPRLAVDPGFALSALATAALVLVAPGWAIGLRRRGVPPGVAEALVVPTAAGLATAPLIAGLSGQISLVSLVANLLVVPAVAPVTVLGVLAAVASPVAAPVATACAWLAGPAVGWLIGVADRAASVPGGVVPWPAGVLGALLLTGLVVGLLVLTRSPRIRVLLLAALIGLLLVLVPTRVVTPGWPPPGWALVTCDVGQGDALVLATGRPGWAVLVDAGPEDGLVDACLNRLGVRALALVVLTHLHADHVGGLAGALRGRPVGGGARTVQGAAVGTGAGHPAGGGSGGAAAGAVARAAAGLARAAAGRARPRAPRRVRRSTGRHRGQRRFGGAARGHCRGLGAAVRRRRARRPGRPARLGCRPASRRPEDAPPRFALQLSRLPRRRRPTGRAGQRRCGQQLRASQPAAHGRAEQGRDHGPAHRPGRGHRVDHTGRHRERRVRARGRQPRRPATGPPAADQPPDDAAPQAPTTEVVPRRRSSAWRRVSSGSAAPP